MTRYWLIETLKDGRSVMTARAAGERFDVPVARSRIGPFGGHVEAADWIAVHGLPPRLAAYELEREQAP